MAARCSAESSGAPSTLGAADPRLRGLDAEQLGDQLGRECHGTSARSDALGAAAPPGRIAAPATASERDGGVGQGDPLGAPAQLSARRDLRLSTLARPSSRNVADARVAAAGDADAAGGVELIEGAPGEADPAGCDPHAGDQRPLYPAPVEQKGRRDHQRGCAGEQLRGLQVVDDELGSTTLARQVGSRVQRHQRRSEASSRGDGEIGDWPVEQQPGDDGPLGLEREPACLARGEADGHRGVQRLPAKASVSVDAAAPDGGPQHRHDQGPGEVVGARLNVDRTWSGSERRREGDCAARTIDHRAQPERPLALVRARARQQLVGRALQRAVHVHGPAATDEPLGQRRGQRQLIDGALQPPRRVEDFAPSRQMRVAQPDAGGHPAPLRFAPPDDAVGAQARLTRARRHRVDVEVGAAAQGGAAGHVLEGRAADAHLSILGKDALNGGRRARSPPWGSPPAAAVERHRGTVCGQLVDLAPAQQGERAPAHRHPARAPDQLALRVAHDHVFGAQATDDIAAEGADRHRAGYALVE